MADVLQTKSGSYKAPNSTEPITFLNGTDTVQLQIVDDYSALGILVTTAAGATTVYEVAIAERT